MQIYIDNYPLAGDQISGFTFRDTMTLQGPNAFSLSRTHAQQVIELVRAYSGDQADRGNIRNAITFQVTREHTRIADAERFMLAHSSEMPSSGLLKVAAQNYVGASSVVFYIERAQVEITNSVYMGLTTIHSYRIHGGAVTKKPS